MQSGTLLAWWLSETRNDILKIFSLKHYCEIFLNVNQINSHVQLKNPLINKEDNLNFQKENKSKQHKLLLLLKSHSAKTHLGTQVHMGQRVLQELFIYNIIISRCNLMDLINKINYWGLILGANIVILLLTILKIIRWISF